MTRARLIALGLALIALVIGGFVLATIDGTGPGGGPSALPPAGDGGTVPVDEDGVVIEPIDEPTATPGPVGAEVTANDPVPDELVQALFSMIEQAGSTPLMNETYTVEFVDTTSRVKIAGRFEEGAATFEFVYEDDTWKAATDL